jgi:hypothetical protein
VKVHFSAPLSGIPTHLPAYIRITEAVSASGHQLIRDWVATYKNPSQAPKSYTDEEWEDISSKTLQAVLQADVVVIEASASSFGTGYLAAVALSYKKPLLMLVSDREYRHYIFDPNNSLRRVEVYHSVDGIGRIVESFLREHDIDAKDRRFNMVLDRETYTFLQAEAIKTGKTKAQIIREVLRERSRNRETPLG